MRSGDAQPDLVDRYEELIASGVYTTGTVHGPPDRSIVAKVLGEALRDRSGKPLRVLDVGCGPGEWLLTIAAIAKDRNIDPLRLWGMDVTPGMIELAGERLAAAALDPVLGIGDILDRSTYGDVDGEGFDLIFTFDVVQQLPRASQFAAVEAMVSALRPGGVLTMFDHDRATPFGRRMGLKKWLTRHGPYPFVPRWYIHAAYPPLEAFARRLAASDRHVRTVGAPDTPRRVLIVERGPS